MTLVGSASASASAWASVNNVNSKVKGKKMICLIATIGTNHFSYCIPTSRLSSAFNPVFRTGAESCNVQFTYTYGVNGGTIQLNEFTVDGVEYNQHTNANLHIYAMN